MRVKCDRCDNVSAYNQKLKAEIERLKSYVPVPKTDAQLVDENAHLKAEIVRLQNLLDKARLKLSYAEARDSDTESSKDTP